MLDILAITVPIYLSIAIGYLATRCGLFAKTDRHAFGNFVIKLAVPALLFKAFAERPIGEVLNLSYLSAYLLGSLIVVGAGLLWAHSVMRAGRTASAVIAMGMSCSNSVFIGYPVVLLTLPPIAGVAMALNTTLENLVVTPLLLGLAESGRAGSGRWHQIVGRSLARLAANPMIIGLLAGFCVSLIGWKLPTPLARTLDLFAMTTGGLALFVIGSTLVGLPMRGMAGRVVPVIVGKLIVHPLAVLFALWLLPALGMPAVDTDLRVAAVVMAAVPMLSIYPILAQLFGHEDVSAAALLMTTIASFFTLSGLLWAIKALPM